MKLKWKKFKSTWELLRDTLSAFSENKIPRLGAALAYYTIFAIAPMFLISLAVAGLWFGKEAASRELFGQLSGLVGKEGGEALQAMVVAASKPKTGMWATALAIVTVIIGATSAFVQLQDALNTVWNVKRESGRGWVYLIKDRLLSFALVISIGFLLMVSLVLNAVLAVLGGYMSHLLPGNEAVLEVINFLVSLGIITLLFALIFKILPDVKIIWRDVWLGAFITACLFNLGKYGLGLYLGRSSVASAYGAAGSLIIVLVWVYYSAQILLLGAKFTQLFAERHGSHFPPVAGAKRVPAKAVDKKTDHRKKA